MLTAEEKETIILYDKSNDECRIYSADRSIINKLDKLYPCIKSEQFDGEIAKTYSTNKKYISFRRDPAFKPDANAKPKRILSPDHLQKMQAARTSAKGR